MGKQSTFKKVTRNDPRTGDAYIREWCGHIGSVIKAGKRAGLYSTHLHVWLNDPDRQFSAKCALQVSHAAKVPVEAILYRFTPIKELGMWKFMK